MTWEQHLRNIIRRTRTEYFGIKFAAWLPCGYFITGGKNKPIQLRHSKECNSRNSTLVAEYPAFYDKAYVYACIRELIPEALAE